jgi:hypothetical protein
MRAALMKQHATYIDPENASGFGTQVAQVYKERR